MSIKTNFSNFNNFQSARQICFRSFIKKYTSSNDIEGSIQKALKTAEINNRILKLTPQHYKGLKGEIIFYGTKFESLDLDPLMEIGHVPADFRSQKTNQYYDVTTNPDYKDIEGFNRNDSRELMIAVVDIKSKEIELIPTSFPTCPDCGDCLHYIYFLEDLNSKNQELVLYCCNCFYSKEVECSNHFFSAQSDFEAEFITDEERNTSEAQKFLNDWLTDISNSAKKEFDVFISAVTCRVAEKGLSKHDIYLFEKPIWIHPILDLEKNANRKIYFPDYEIKR